MSAADGPSLLLRPDRVIDGDGRALPPGTEVRIAGRRILAVGPGGGAAGDDGQVVPLPGCSLLPGFVDLHGYLSIDPDLPEPMRQMHGSDLAARRRIAEAHLARDLASGVTTMRVMGEGGGLDIALRADIEAGRIAGPALLVSGMPVCPDGSHQAPPTGGWNTPDEIRRAIDVNAAAGADWIKLVATGGVNAPGDSGRQPLYDPSRIAAAMEAASKAGLPVAVAAHGGPAVRAAVEAGAATIEHCALFDDEDITAIARGGAVPVLTLSRFFSIDGIARSARHRTDVLARLAEACEQMRALVPALATHGVRFALGTDNMHGRIAEDAAFAVELGLSPAEAIAALTGFGAQTLATSRPIGFVRPGMDADLVAVRGDPLADIRALDAVKAVWQRGRRIRERNSDDLKSESTP